MELIATGKDFRIVVRRSANADVLAVSELLDFATAKLVLTTLSTNAGNNIAIEPTCRSLMRFANQNPNLELRYVPRNCGQCVQGWLVPPTQSQGFTLPTEDMTFALQSPSVSQETKPVTVASAIAKSKSTASTLSAVLARLRAFIARRIMHWKRRRDAACGGK
jgi:hypothetical protein